MRLTMMMIAACLLAVSTAQAHGGQDKSHRHAEKAAQMIEALGLEEGQQEAVQAILSEQREKARGLRKSTRKDMKALRTETREKLAAVLSEEQLQNYDRFIADKRKQRKRRWRQRDAE